MIANLSRLRELHLLNNRLTHLPESMGGLRELRQVDRRGNPLTSLPSSMMALPRLEKLDLRWEACIPPRSLLNELKRRGCVVLL